MERSLISNFAYGVLITNGALVRAKCSRHAIYCLQTCSLHGKRVVTKLHNDQSCCSDSSLIYTQTIFGLLAQICSIYYGQKVSINENKVAVLILRFGLITSLADPIEDE